MKQWRQSYDDEAIGEEIYSAEFPCMTIVRSMEQLEALQGTMYQIDFEHINSYECTLEEGYLCEEFFAEHDFVILLSYESSGSNRYGIQSLKITTNHILEVVLSRYYPATGTCDMSMQVKGIAVPKGCLNQVGGYVVTWEYFGHDSNVPEGNESSTAYDYSIPDVLYIENELYAQ